MRNVKIILLILAVSLLVQLGLFWHFRQQLAVRSSAEAQAPSGDEAVVTPGMLRGM